MRKCKKQILLAIIVILTFGWFAAAGAQDTPKININTASADELVQLKGIGPKKAAQIIEFREANGPFQKAEDLVNVPGIGPKTYDANKHRITVE